MGEAEQDKCPVDICPAERVAMDGYPGLLRKAGLRSVKALSGERSAKAEKRRISEFVGAISFGSFSLGAQRK